MSALKHHCMWKGSGRKSQGQNRTREIRPSGIAGRPLETWAMVELGTHRTTERVRLVTLHLMLRAPGFYPDQYSNSSNTSCLKLSPPTLASGKNCMSERIC